MNSADIQRQLHEKMPNADIRVESNDNIHFTATIISDQFTGLSRLAQHRIVYAILAEDLKENIHALQLITQSPEEKNDD
tara:strand:+ start:293 stop:529 length:237 start_codon:yes stop_codon:yes gene_type:complete